MAKASSHLLGGSLRRVTNTELGTNSYLLSAPGQTGPGSACTIIDPGLDRTKLEKAIYDTGWLPESVLCTHGHFDHVGGAAWLQQRFGVPVFLCPADLKLAKLSNFMMAAFKMKNRIELPDFTVLDALKTADIAMIVSAGRQFIFHAMPGHTIGSCVIAVDSLLFSGDSLYARRIGLSKLPGEDHEQLRNSLRWLFSWVNGQVLVMPGHGGEATIDEIHACNSELHAFMTQARLP